MVEVISELLVESGVVTESDDMVEPMNATSAVLVEYSTVVKSCVVTDPIDVVGPISEVDVYEVIEVEIPELVDSEVVEVAVEILMATCIPGCSKIW